MIPYNSIGVGSINKVQAADTVNPSVSIEVASSL